MADATSSTGGLVGRSPAGEPVKALALKYAKAFSGDGARVFIQLFYFYLVANALSIAEFGLFATASAVGIVLSRVAGFGFLSALYRIATVKPQLIGAYTTGYGAAVALSLPLVGLLGWGTHALFFAGEMTLLVFALIAATEILAWRTLEVVINVNKGLERFGRASLAIIFGFSMKAVAALALALAPDPSLALWSAIYAAVQTVMALAAIALFYPRVRLRFVPQLYWRRIPDALAVSGSEVLFYVQSELDKLVVLAFGGPAAAGLYAIVMRLVDLTAMPVRTFSTILSQRLMRRPGLMDSLKMRLGFEAGVFVVSALGMAAMAIVFAIKPDVLGTNVAAAAPLVGAVLLVAGFRNLIEYQAELLYGRGQTGIRLVNYAIIGALKAVMLVALLTAGVPQADWMIALNGVFAMLWLVSALLTYRVLGRPAKPV